MFEPIDQRYIEELCERFREEWNQNSVAPYSSYLSLVHEHHRLSLLVRLIQTEMESAFSRTTRELSTDDLHDDDRRAEPRLELMLARFPELRACPRSCMELAVFEYATRRNSPSPLDIEHYVELFPELGEKLGSLLYRVECQLLTNSMKPDRFSYAKPSSSTVPESIGEPMHAWRLPKQLGYYQLLSHVGTGGMGTVFRALDLRTGGIFAVKVMRRTDAWSVYRFNEEFRALASLDHPNLARLNESYSDDNLRYFSMEYVSGRSLHQWWQRRRKSDDRWGWLCKVLSQIASGIQFLHNRGLLHGDIKCGNVLVTQRGRAVLLDFGLVTFVENLPTTQRKQKENRLVGTLCYLAPEIIGGGSPSVKTDWYSFGAMLYELLTGNPPTPQEESTVDDTSSNSKIAVEQRLIQSGAPSHIIELCLGLIAYDPRLRPEGQSVCRILHASFDASRPRQPELDHLPFVGRDESMREFKNLVENSDDKASIILLTGNEGIGVSRFLSQWSRDFAGLVLNVSCFRQDANPYPILNSMVQSLVNQGWNLAPFCEKDQRSLTKIASTFPQAKQLLLDAPWIEVADCSLEESVSEFIELLKRISHRHSVVIVIEDVEWGDEASFAWLNSLWEGEPFKGIVVLTRSQHGEHDSYSAQMESHLATLTSTAGDLKIRRMSLPPLDEASCLELARVVLTCNGMPIQFDHDLPHRMASACRGNPQILLELVKSIWAQDPSGASWGEFLARMQGSDIAEFRYLRLKNESQQILQLLAIAISPVTFQQLQYSSRVGPELLLPHLGTLASQGWLRWEGLWPDLSLRLANELDASRIVGWTDPERIKRRHWRLAHALTREVRPNWFAIGHHFMCAGKPKYAMQPFLEAASNAAKSGDAAGLASCEECIKSVALSMPDQRLTVGQQRLLDQAKECIGSTAPRSKQ